MIRKTIILLIFPFYALADQCQITSPLPMPVSINGCTFSSALPNNSTSYVQNTLTPTISTQAFSVSSGTITSSATLSYLTGTQCLHEVNGSVLGTGSDCGAGGGGNGGVTVPSTFTWQGVIISSLQVTSTNGGLTVSSAAIFNGNVTISSTVGLSNGAGTNGQFLTSGGGGTSPTWTTGNAGTVTGVTASNGATSSGGATPNITVSSVSLSSQVVSNLPVGNLNSGTNADSSHFWRGDAQWISSASFLTGNQTITLSADATGSGTTAIAVTNAAQQNNITTFGASSITINGGLLVKPPITTIYELTLATSPTQGTQNISISTNAEIVITGSTGTSGQFLSSQGPGLPVKWTSGNAGTVTSVTGTAPINSSGGTTPAISLSTVVAQNETFTSSVTFSTSTSYLGNMIISSAVTLSNGVGTNGQALTSGGAGTSPTWTTISGGSGSGIVSPGTFTWVNNFGLQVSTLQAINATGPTTLVVSTAGTGISQLAVSSTIAALPTDSILSISSASGTTILWIDNAGNLISSGTTPSVSSCGSAPAGSVIGNNISGQITVGGGVVTACTLTFANGGFVNAPICVFSDNSVTVNPSLGATSGASQVINLSATLGGGLINYVCVGFQK